MTVENLGGIAKLCTGCLSCMNICPQNAISTAYKTDGFLYPVIDGYSCIDCGLCVKACPINTHIEKTDRLKVYSAAAKSNDIRAEGSSGGIFPLLATEFFERGGAVYGVAFSREQLAYHMSADKVGIKALFRSKYIQSNSGLTYRDVERDLLASREVLFVGTPCQVRGLKCYLKERRVSEAKLITMDFMCHGVPSPRYFNEFIAREEKEEDCLVQEVTFREKDLGWRRQAVNIYFENNKKKQYLSENSFYYYFFLKNYNLRESCYECKEFSNHVSDITVADHWGVEKQEDDDGGRSLIIVHTPKGDKQLQNILNNCEVRELEENQYNENIYSHHKYDIKLKRKWLSVYIERGEEYTSKVFFKKEKINGRIRGILSQFLQCVKKIIKAVLKGKSDI